MRLPLRLNYNQNLLHARAQVVVVVVMLVEVAVVAAAAAQVVWGGALERCVPAEPSMASMAVRHK